MSPVLSPRKRPRLAPVSPQVYKYQAVYGGGHDIRLSQPWPVLSCTGSRQHAGRFDAPRSPDNIVVAGFWNFHQYLAASAPADHWYKQFMDDVDAFDRLWAKSDQNRITLEVGWYNGDGIAAMGPSGRTLPTAFNYRELPNYTPTLSDLETWWDAIVADMDFSPTAAVFFSANLYQHASWPFFNSGLQKNTRLKIIHCDAQPYAHPDWHRWISEMTRIIELIRGVQTLTFAVDT